MTVYTDETLTSWYVDEADPAVFEFVDDLGNDVILIEGGDTEASFFGFLRLVLWQ